MAAGLAISRALHKRLEQARVARLATADSRGRPHLVPVCFAFDGRAFYTPLDRKPKQRPPDELRRVQNIKANPQVALLVDEYGEDWRRLWHILIRGRARLLRRGAHWRTAHRLLKRKYPQYRTGWLPAEAPVIQILPKRMAAWGRL